MKKERPQRKLRAFFRWFSEKKRCIIWMIPSLFGVWQFGGSPAKEIINAYIVIICQHMQNRDRNIQFAQLIIGIGCLVYLQVLGQLLLGQVQIFPEIAQTVFVHNITR